MKFRPALLAMLATVLFAGSVHAQMLRVTIRKAPIRSGPTSQDTLVASAMQGDLLEYVDAEGLWYIVRVPGTQQVGYVHSALVEQSERRAPAPAPQTPTPTTAPPPPMSAPVLQPCAPPPPPPPRRTTTAPPPAPRPREPLPKTPPSIDPATAGEAPWDHRGFGIGTRMGHSTLGKFALNTRMWGDGLGLSFDLASDVNQWQLQPSLMFKIGQPIQAESVYFQPYFGVGADVFFHRIINDSGVGLVALGGTDLGFQALPNLTVSFDLGYRSDPLSTDCRSDCFTSNFSDRLGLNFGVDWYFK